MASVNNPILIQTYRGNLLENRHRGSYVVVNTEGDILSAAGNFQETIYARSSLKPINVLAMIMSGAADHFNVTDKEIALACASHSGEEEHVNAIHQWIERIGCTPQNLECGIHAPISQSARRALQSKGVKPTTLHNACSGKHAGFLTLTKFLDYPVKGYTNIDHPTQKMILETASKMIGIKVDETPKGIDGCRIPMLAMPLKNLAMAMTNLLTPDNLDPKFHDACPRVINAMKEYPFYVAGTNRFDTVIAEQTKGGILVKMGADGVYSGIVPKKKWGIALKIDDGNLLAAETALFHLLRRLELLPKDLYADGLPLHKWNQYPIQNYLKEDVGNYESAF